LHTRNVASTITALRDLHIDNRSLAGNLGGIISQRLVRRLCLYCRRPEPTSSEEGQVFLAEGLEVPTELYHPVGCPRCRQAGYWERVGILEVVGNNPEIIKAIEQGVSEDEMRRVVRAAGTSSLQVDGLTKVREGITNLEEIRGMTSV